MQVIVFEFRDTLLLLPIFESRRSRWLLHAMVTHLNHTTRAVVCRLVHKVLTWRWQIFFGCEAEYLYFGEKK